MTIYLTKEVEGKTHHFTTIIENDGVNIIQGVFYNWISKSWQGCENNADALKRQKELVDEKLKEGFNITEYQETLENTMNVYDKAKWHFGGDFPEDLDDFQGYVHTGMFLGWLIDSDLISEEFAENNDYDIELFKQRKITGAQVFEKCCDGVLMLEDISELGNRFALHYFEFENGQYLKDYEALSQGYPSQYHVPDTWDNYSTLKAILDKRYNDWKQS